MITNPLLRSALALFGSTALLPAATYFTEDFSDFSPSPNMALGTGYGSPSTSFAGGNFTITSGINSRVYLGTVGADYSLSNFVFQCTVTVPNNTNAWAIAFIGMGSSTAGVGTNQFGEPITGSDLFMAVRNDVGRLESRDNAAVATDVGIQVTPVTGIPNATHLLRMSWNATTKQAFYEFDKGNNGSIDGSFSLDGSDNGFDDTNSQLVLGGGNGLIFDNISIIPEPSAALLGGLGVLALLRRRR